MYLPPPPEPHVPKTRPAAMIGELTLRFSSTPGDSQFDLAGLQVDAAEAVRLAVDEQFVRRRRAACGPSASSR